MKVALRKKKMNDGTRSLYLDVYYRQERNYEFLKLYLVEPKTVSDRQRNKETLLLAESIAAKRLVELQTGEYGHVPQHRKQTDFVTYFEELTAARKKTGINYDTWLSVLRHLEKYVKGKPLPVERVNEKWLVEFRTYIEKKVSANSAHTYFNKVKAAVHQAFRDKLISSDPAFNVTSPKPEETQREYLTAEEVQKLVKTPCRYPILKKAFLFSVLTGLRWSDIQKLKWKDIQDQRLHFRQQKTKQVEYLPISDQAMQLLGNAGDPEDKIFRGLKYSAYINVGLAQWVLAAGVVKHITFHCARHTHATLLLNNGTDIYTVSKLLGHKNIKTTQIYAKVVDATKVQAVNQIPLIL
ncbi:site-specific integrase [Pontibacter anaerobius]|uniref:Site-specific integrase n=1 Tax=Pontibacter anaerobius TaxID=2993940 RepID=A0ABT3RJ62_9BACT|nr:site-specific integrase [Pontibacter anaerobius]MCX2741471.1 site-specific integrase [Pontibacter anaerobius]